LVAYKNVRSIVQAFTALPNEKLIIVGDGPERSKLQQLASPNVEFRGHVPDPELRKLMREARAFIFAAEEDFGIAPLEAQGEGTPVIALGRGGARETIITTGATPTGLFFSRPEPAEIVGAVTDFLRTARSYSAFECWRNAVRFSEERFISAFTDHVQLELSSFRERMQLQRLLYPEVGSLSG
jgi:glycosyltransferase involved in cell wall biosynthesis